MPGAGTRRCTECPNPVEGRSLTCSPACRSRRSRRVRKAGDEAAPPVDDGTRGEAVRDALREELRPIIREAITADVLEGIKDLVGHVPEAIKAAVDDLASPDDDVRGRAYTLILRYTIGNQAIVPDINDAKQQELNVNFNLPRPDPAGEVEGGGVIESKECDSCGTTKPLDEFVGTSDRCQVCFDEMRRIAAERLGGEAVAQDG